MIREMNLGKSAVSLSLVNKVKATLLATVLVSMSSAFANDSSAIPVFEISAGESKYDIGLNSQGGPYREDIKQMQFRFSGSQLSTLYSQFSEVVKIDKGVFYFELRDLKIASLKVTEDNRRDITLATIPLTQGEDLSALVSLSRPATTVSVSVVGEQERFKCFSPETCVFDGMEKVGTRATGSSVNVIQFETIATTQDGEAVLQKRISNPAEQRVVISEKSASDRLGRKIFTGLGSPASSLTNFKGFAQTLETYGSGGPLTVAHVYPAYGGLKVSVETAPFYFCEFTRVVSYPDTFRVPTPLGQGCTFPGGYDGRTSVSGDSPGSDSKIVKDWLFQNLR